MSRADFQRVQLSDGLRSSRVHFFSGILLFAIMVGMAGPARGQAGAPAERHLSPEFRKELSSCLASVPGTVSITAPKGNIEALSYAEDWYYVFRAAHWTIVDKKIHSYANLGSFKVGTEIVFRGTPQGEHGATYSATSAGGRIVDCVRGKIIHNDMPRLVPDRDAKENEISITVGSALVNLENVPHYQRAKGR